MFEWVTSKAWEETLDWLYSQLMGFVTSLFDAINGMSVEVFDLAWVQAIVHFCSLFGWALFVTGLVVAVFDTAIGAQSGRADIHGTALNAIKGFFAVCLFTVAPVDLYRFCITLQGSLSTGMASLLHSSVIDSAVLAQMAMNQLQGSMAGVSTGLFTIFLIIAIVYCVIKVFMQNLKRGGILLIQIAVGALYMFSVPRGYTDGYFQWVKRVIGLCLTAFLQTTILVAGLLTFRSNQLLGIGLMLSAKEVDRIAEAYGLDTSAKGNAMSVVYATSSVVNVTRQIAAAVK